jgi:hypothetical protein
MTYVYFVDYRSSSSIADYACICGKLSELQVTYFYFIKCQMKALFYLIGNRQSDLFSSILYECSISKTVIGTFLILNITDDGSNIPEDKIDHLSIITPPPLFEKIFDPKYVGNCSDINFSQPFSKSDPFTGTILLEPTHFLRNSRTLLLNPTHLFNLTHLFTKPKTILFSPTHLFTNSRTILFNPTHFLTDNPKDSKFESSSPIYFIVFIIILSASVFLAICYMMYRIYNESKSYVMNKGTLTVGFEL